MRHHPENKVPGADRTQRGVEVGLHNLSLYDSEFNNEVLFLEPTMDSEDWECVASKISCNMMSM